MTKALKTSALLIAIFAVFTAAMVGLNLVTGPIIEKNNASAALGALTKVMPDAKGFEQIYAKDGSVSSALTGVADTVVSINKETSGLGFVLQLSTTKGYTGNAIELTLAVDSEGKISGISLDAYPETKDFGAGYPATFIGQDSALADVQIVAGCTYSSVAFRDAVLDGMNALISNNLITAGVKSDAQLLLEQVGSFHSGLVNSKNVGQYEELEGSGNIVTILKPTNNSGFGYILKNGESNLFAAVNNSLQVKIFGVDGADVTAQYSALADEVKAHAEANISNNTEKDIQRMNILMPESTVTEISLGASFNTVTSAYKIEKDGKVYYGLVSRSHGYDNKIMGVYYILDESGAIVSMHVDEFIFDSEYYHNYTLDPTAYKQGFIGLTQGTWSDDKALITGATMTADAIKVATRDIFAAFETVKGGAQ